MNSFKTIFQFTFYHNLRKKAFIVATIVILVIVVILLMLPKVLGSGTSSAIPANMKLYVYDQTGYVNLSYLKAKPVTAAQVSNIKSRIAKDKNTGLVVVSLKNNRPAATVYAQSQSSLPVSVISDLIQADTAAKALAPYHVSPGVVTQIMTPPQVTVESIGGGNINNTFIGIFLVILMFFGTFFYAMSVASEIASEKDSRVMETLITSANPRAIIFGKTLAMGLISFIQFALVLLVGSAVIHLAYPGNFSLGGLTLDFSVLTPATLLVCILYFILIYFLFAMLQAMIASSISKMQDLQPAMMPLTFFIAICFYLGFYSFFAPGSLYNQIVVYVPFTSAFIVPTMLVMQTISWWQVAISLVILAVTSLGIGLFASRVYSMAVLYYGTRLKFTQLFKLKQ